MNSTGHFPLRLAALLAAGCLASAPALSAAAGTTSAKSTNTVSLDLPVPRAVFDVTSSPVKDPFYPRTTRSPVPVTVVAATAAPAISASSFQLKALSGAEGARLATVNNRTVAVGETADVTTPAGKIRILCLAINDSSVLIKVPSQSEPIEVRLRKNF